MITRSTSPDGTLDHRGGSKRVAKWLLGLALGLLGLGLVVALTLWYLLLSPFAYTPPADAPLFDQAQAQPVFVYGTLRRPVVRRLVLGRWVDAREAALPGFRRERLNIVPDPQSVTYGELIEVHADELRRLDRYERLGVRYERVWLRLDHGSSAWVYRRLPSP